MDMDKVKELRSRTQASMSACKRVLEQCNGDVEKAAVALQRSGEARVADLGKRVASEGRVYTYRHPGDRLAVVVEVNCQTDFVARSQEFGQLCDDVAMQIAGMGARYVGRPDVPESDLVAKRDDIVGTFDAAADRLKARGIGRPEYRGTLSREEFLSRLEPRVMEQLEKWFKEVCLLEQPLLSDPSKTVEQALLAYSAKVGEKVAVRRFVRWELAEGVERLPVEDYAAEVARLAGGG